MKIDSAASSSRRPPLSGGEVRRIVIMSVVAVILLAFILKGVLTRNEAVEAGTPVVVQGQGQPPEPSQPEPPPDRPDGSDITLPSEGDPQALLSVRDHTEMDLAEPGLLYLVRAVTAQTPEAISARVDSTVAAGRLMEEPARYRGRYVRSIGTLDHLEPIWFPSDNPAGVERGWQGYIFPRSERPVHFIVLEKDREFDIEHDTVKIEGPFLKIHTYESVIGKTIAFPMIIARRLEYVEDVTYDEAYPKGLGYAAVGVVLVVVLIIGVAMFRSSRRDASVEEERRKQRQNRRQASSGGGGS